MLSRYQRQVLLIVVIMALAIQGCNGNTVVIPSQVTSPTAMIPTTTETPSPKPSATKTTTPDDIATANFSETASIGTLVATVQPTVIATYSSTDGKWHLQVIRYDCAYVFHDYNDAVAYEQLRLINLRDGTEKTVANQLQYCAGLGTYGFGGLAWSPSNRYFYYTDSREGFPDGGGCGDYLRPLYRLDIITNEILKLNGGYPSPDQTKLATWQGHEIVIWDLDKGEIARVTSLHPSLFNRRIWWSRKGDSLVYLQTELECAPNLGKSFLVNLDLANLSQNLITEYEITNSGFVSTPSPAGTFVFYFYAPLIMNYDPSIWEIKNGGLQAQEVTTCSIVEQGPMDFNGPHTSEFVRLANIRYEVLNLPDSSPNYVSRVYIADQAHATETGLPVFSVSAKSNEWIECRPLAEEVLSTLHFPP